jgi:hypothetical protein
VPSRLIDTVGPADLPDPTAARPADARLGSVSPQYAAQPPRDQSPARAVRCIAVYQTAQCASKGFGGADSPACRERQAWQRASFDGASEGRSGGSSHGSGGPSNRALIVRVRLVPAVSARLRMRHATGASRLLTSALVGSEIRWQSRSSDRLLRVNWHAAVARARTRRGRRRVVHALPVRRCVIRTGGEILALCRIAAVGNSRSPDVPGFASSRSATSASNQPSWPRRAGRQAPRRHVARPRCRPL